jgi:hypothetical protein
MKKAVLLIAVMLLLLLCSCGAYVGKETETTSIDASAAATSEKSDDIPFYTKEIKDDPSDPYSGFIKEACEAVVDGWQGLEAEDFEDFFKNRYCTHYFLYDLNGDGVEEMLLGKWVKVGHYTDDPNPPTALKPYFVCTLKDGEVEYMDFDSLYWSEFIYDRVLYSNGLVMTTWGPEKNPSCIFAYFDGQELKQKDFLFHLMPDDIYLEIDESEMTEEEYHRRIDEAIGDATPVEIEWKRIDEYGQ